MSFLLFWAAIGALAYLLLFVIGRLFRKKQERKCPYCAEGIQPEAIVCKHCHKDLPTKIAGEGVAVAASPPARTRDHGPKTGSVWSKQFRMNPVLVVIVLVVLVTLGLRMLPQPDYGALERGLEYLKTVEGIRWVEFDNNDVYVGFGSELPDDWRAVVNAAAFNGNRALDFGVNVWAVQGVQLGWRPGGKGFLCEATARYGQLEDKC